VQNERQVLDVGAGFWSKRPKGRHRFKDSGVLISETAIPATLVCGRSLAGIAGSDPVGGVNVCCECSVVR